MWATTVSRTRVAVAGGEPLTQLSELRVFLSLYNPKQTQHSLINEIDNCLDKNEIQVRNIAGKYQRKHTASFCPL